MVSHSPQASLWSSVIGGSEAENISAYPPPPAHLGRAPDNKPGGRDGVLSSGYKLRRKGVRVQAEWESAAGRWHKQRLTCLCCLWWGQRPLRSKPALLGGS